MRWSYLIPRVVIVAAVWLFFTLAFDPLLRWGAVWSGQKIAGARVDLESLTSTFFPPSMAVGRVQVANRAEPMSNLIEFASLRFHLEGDPLLRQRFVIDEATLTGLEWGTPRTESGQLPDRPAPSPEEQTGPGLFDGLGQAASELGQDWLAELTRRAKDQVDLYQFESVRLADGMYHDWKARFEAYEDRIKRLEARVKELEQTIKNADGSTLEKLRQYDTARREVNELLAEADRLRKELPELGRQANGDYRAIDAARQRDLAELRRKLDMFRLDAETISEALLGPELRGRLAETIGWIQWFRKKLDAVRDQPEPERLRGIDVDFSPDDKLPLLLVRKLKLTGQTELGGDVLPFQGVVTGITSDPALHGQPVVVRLYGQQNATVQVRAVIDHTVPVPVYDVAIAYALPEPTEMQLGQESEVMLHLAAERTGWQADFRLEGDQLTGALDWRQSPVTVSLDVDSELRDEIRRVLEQSLREVRDIRATVNLSGSYKHPHWKIESNLGRQISSGMTAALSHELEVRREELARQVDEIARQKMNEFSGMLNQQFNEVVADLNLNEQNARQLIQRLADNSDLNVETLSEKLDLDEEQRELIRKAGLEKKLDLNKIDFKKLFD